MSWPESPNRSWIIAVPIAGCIYGAVAWSLLSPVGLAADARPSYGGSAVIYADNNGRYVASVDIGEATFQMLVDTGASNISLSHSDAIRAGVDVQKLQYDVDMQTSGGTKKVAFATLPLVAVGGIKMENVKAVVSRAGEGRSAILGRAFLGRLGAVEFRNGTLTLDGGN